MPMLDKLGIAVLRVIMTLTLVVTDLFFNEVHLNEREVTQSVPAELLNFTSDQDTTSEPTSSPDSQPVSGQTENELILVLLNNGSSTITF